VTYFSDYIDAKRKYLNAAFVNIALGASWSPDIVRKISVEINEGAPDLRIPADIKTKVNDLEYGKPGQPATYVLRKFKEVVDDVVSEATINAVYHALSPNTAPSISKVE
jgi:hypothetical protein